MCFSWENWFIFQTVSVNIYILLKTIRANLANFVQNPIIGCLKQIIISFNMVAWEGGSKVSRFGLVR